MTLDCVLLKDRNLALAPRQGLKLILKPIFECYQDLCQIL